MKALLIIHLIILLGLSTLTTQAMGECPIKVSTNDGDDSKFYPRLKNLAYPAVKDILIKKGYIPYYSNFDNNRKNVDDELRLIWRFGESSITEYIQGVHISKLEMKEEKDFDDHTPGHIKAMDLLKSLARQIRPCEEFSKLKSFVTNNVNKWNTAKKAANTYWLQLKCDDDYWIGGEYYLTPLKRCVQFLETTDFINQFSSRRINQLQFWDYERNHLILSNEFDSFRKDAYTHKIKIDMGSVLDNKNTIEDVMKYLELKQ